jgi:hypothetical protein
LYGWATNTSLGANGQITSPGVVTAVFCAEFQSSFATGYIGGVVNLPKIFPVMPSSVTWTMTYNSGTVGGPSASLQFLYGMGWYASFINGPGDIYVGGYVTVS